MFVKGDLREGRRTSFVTPVRYSVSVLETKGLKTIHDAAVSIDIDAGGLGILTGYPLETGHILTFKDEININGIEAKSAVVRWSGKFENNKYRVGLKFMKQQDKVV
jgi:hypothetical protein